MKSILLTATLILILSQSAFSKVYEIKAGAHSASGYNFGFFTASTQSFQAKFNSSAVYNLGNINQHDINKLFGFSDCSSAHQTNSARFGWVWNLDTSKLEIHAYTYTNRVRSSQFIGTAALNTLYSYQISVSANNYIFKFKGRTVTLPRACNSRLARGYKLFPYFGGNEVSPHNIKIEIF